MDRFDTIRLLGNDRIKKYCYTILFLSTLLIISTILVYLLIPFNFVLLIILFIEYIFLITYTIYFMVNTDDKLIPATLFVGISMMGFSIAIFITFSFFYLNNNIRAIFVSIAIFFFVGIVIEVLLIKTKFFNFKNVEKRSNTLRFGILGAVIGSSIYRICRDNFGENITSILGVGALLLLIFMFEFLGVFFINKYMIVKKYRHIVNIRYDE